MIHKEAKQGGLNDRSSGNTDLRHDNDYDNYDPVDPLNDLLGCMALAFIVGTGLALVIIVLVGLGRI